MPESPRWLISQNRRQEAQKIIQNSYERMHQESPKVLEAFPDSSDVLNSSPEFPATKSTKEKKGMIRSNLKSLGILFSHSDLRKRVFIMYFSWMTSSLCYYAIGNDKIKSVKTNDFKMNNNKNGSIKSNPKKSSFPFLYYDDSFQN